MKYKCNKWQVKCDVKNEANKMNWKCLKNALAALYSVFLNMFNVIALNWQRKLKLHAYIHMYIYICSSNTFYGHATFAVMCTYWQLLSRAYSELLWKLFLHKNTHIHTYTYYIGIIYIIIYNIYINIII